MREFLRSWTESIETQVLEVIEGHRRSNRAALLRTGLYGLSLVFKTLVKTRRFLYSARLMRDSTLGVQVIAIGNLTVGGTGKTPVVEKFARELQDEGRKVAILSRGYRSKPAPFHRRFLNRILFRSETTPPRVVSDGNSLLLDSEMAGDEPYMLASNLKDVVVLVDKDRVKSGRYAIQRFGCDTLLLDDGFQYWKLQGRRHDVVLIDFQKPFGNGHLLPRGVLREPPSHLRRAGTIFITKSDGDTTALRERIQRHNPDAGIIECVHHPLYFEDVFTGKRLELEHVKGVKVATLSGIAQPESFERSLIELGNQLVYQRRFADHHRYSQQEVLDVINRSVRRGAEMIITTQKDAVRFPKIDRRDIPLYFMRVEIKIMKGAKDSTTVWGRSAFARTMETLLYWICKGFIRAVQCLPMRGVARLGRGVGALMYRIDARHRRRALDNIRSVYPDWTDREVAALAGENFRRVAENFACAIKASSMETSQLLRYVEVEGGEVLRTVGRSGGPRNVIVAIGHFGNFELFARFGTLFDVPHPATTYRALKGRVANRLVEDLRARAGIHFYERRRDVRALRQAMKEGGVVLGLLSDQHAGGGGVVAKFMGRECSCTLAPGVLAHRYGADLYSAICYRTDLARWRVEVGDQIPVRDDQGPRPKEEIAQAVQDVLTDAVRRDPANWFWAHRRWRTGGRSFMRQAARHQAEAEAAEEAESEDGSS